MAGKQVSLDGQVLHGHDRYGWWQVNKIEGWDETPACDTEVTGSANLDE